MVPSVFTSKVRWSYEMNREQIFAIGLTVLLTCELVHAQVPQTVAELWGSYDPRAEPLNVEVVSNWVDGAGTFQLVRYDIGTLAGDNITNAHPKIAAYYGYPTGASNLPGIVHIHGGGQKADKTYVTHLVNDHGYAAISINWGALVLEQTNTPNTDWDGIAAGFARTGVPVEETFHDDVLPTTATLYTVSHPLNSSWMMNSLAARRALTFLEQQSVVNSNNLGVTGHSMGGRSTIFTANDPRLKVATPSVGGTGFLYEDWWGLPGTARSTSGMGGDDLALYNSTVAAQAYWPEINCPVLFLEASDDFNAPMELVIKAMNLQPNNVEQRLAIAPHYNHVFDEQAEMSRILWHEAQQKGTFDFPQNPWAELDLDQPDGIPVYRVWPDTNSAQTVVGVDIYYGYMRDPRIRFWHDAQATQVGDHWEAQCPVFDNTEPLFAFANIVYEMAQSIKATSYSSPTNRFKITAQYRHAYPPTLVQYGVINTVIRARVIDDFARGMHDWYSFNLGHQTLWEWRTRKFADPVFFAPKGSVLQVDLTTSASNALGIKLGLNAWQGGEDWFSTVVILTNAGSHTFTLSASDFTNSMGQVLADWDVLITEFVFTPGSQVDPDDPALWDWTGAYPVFTGLEWVGGAYPPDPASLSNGFASTMHLYRLGEDDPGAGLGSSGVNPTVDSIGSTDIPASSTHLADPVYVAGVSTGLLQTGSSTLAMDFNAGEYYMIDPFFNETNNFVVEMWLRPDAIDSNYRVFLNGMTGGYTSNSTGYVLELNSLGNLLIRLINATDSGDTGTYSASSAQGGTTLATGEWAHAAMVLEDDVFTLYLNGKEEASITMSAGRHIVPPNALPGAKFALGANQSSQSQFDGAIDELRCFTYSNGVFSVTNHLNLTASMLVAGPNADSDSDEDGLPNLWEIGHNMDPNDDGGIEPDNGATGDPDGDGADNVNEYVAGTDPTNRSDYFRFTYAANVTGGIVISWPSVTGKIYRVVTTSDLTDSGSWSNVLDAEYTNKSGDGLIIDYTNTQYDLRRFYRINVE